MHCAALNKIALIILTISQDVQESIETYCDITYGDNDHHNSKLLFIIHKYN